MLRRATASCSPKVQEKLNRAFTNWDGSASPKNKQRFSGFEGGGVCRSYTIGVDSPASLDSVQSVDEVYEDMDSGGGVHKDSEPAANNSDSEHDTDYSYTYMFPGKNKKEGLDKKKTLMLEDVQRVMCEVDSSEEQENSGLHYSAKSVSKEKDLEKIDLG